MLFLPKIFYIFSTNFRSFMLIITYSPRHFIYTYSSLSLASSVVCQDFRISSHRARLQVSLSHRPTSLSLEVPFQALCGLREVVWWRNNDSWIVCSLTPSYFQDVPQAPVDKRLSILTYIVTFRISQAYRSTDLTLLLNSCNLVPLRIPLPILLR